MPLMQKVLSLLMAFVLLQVQAHALSGGPVFGGATLNVVGTYAGVLIPEDIDEELAIATTQRSSASIGLFSLGVPDVGPATGGVVVFVDGTSFNGNLTGVVDPGNGNFQAIIDAVSAYSIVFPVDTDGDGDIDATIDTAVFAQGSIDARIVSLVTGGNSFSSTPATSTRLAGTASVDVFYLLEADGTPDVSNTATYAVDGFKQSDTVSQVTFDFGEFDFGDVDDIDDDDNDTNNNNNN